jgi:hypothetical protein
MKTAYMWNRSNHNFGKDEYVVDMAGHEAQYWQGTESGLLGAFEFQGACSCDTDSRSWGQVSVTSTALGGTLKHHYPLLSS